MTFFQQNITISFCIAWQIFYILPQHLSASSPSCISFVDSAEQRLWHWYSSCISWIVLLVFCISRTWNQILICLSVRLSMFAISILRGRQRYLHIIRISIQIFLRHFLRNLDLFENHINECNFKKINWAQFKRYIWYILLSLYISYIYIYIFYIYIEHTLENIIIAPHTEQILYRLYN